MGYILKLHLKSALGCLKKPNKDEEDEIVEIIEDDDVIIEDEDDVIIEDEIVEIIGDDNVNEVEQDEQQDEPISQAQIVFTGYSDAEETSSSTPSQTHIDEGSVLFLKRYAEHNKKKLYEIARRNNASVVGLYHGSFVGSTLESCICTWPAHNEIQIKQMFAHQNIHPYYIFYTS